MGHGFSLQQERLPALVGSYPPFIGLSRPFLDRLLLANELINDRWALTLTQMVSLVSIAEKSLGDALKTVEDAESWISLVEENAKKVVKDELKADEKLTALFHDMDTDNNSLVDAQEFFFTLILFSNISVYEKLTLLTSFLPTEASSTELISIIRTVFLALRKACPGFGGYNTAISSDLSGYSLTVATDAFLALASARQEIRDEKINSSMPLNVWAPFKRSELFEQLLKTPCITHLLAACNEVTRMTTAMTDEVIESSADTITLQLEKLSQALQHRLTSSILPSPGQFPRVSASIRHGYTLSTADDDVKSWLEAQAEKRATEKSRLEKLAAAEEEENQKAIDELTAQAPQPRKWIDSAFLSEEGTGLMDVLDLLTPVDPAPPAPVQSYAPGIDMTVGWVSGVTTVQPSQTAVGDVSVAVLASLPTNNTDSHGLKGPSATDFSSSALRNLATRFKGATKYIDTLGDTFFSVAGSKIVTWHKPPREEEEEPPASGEYVEEPQEEEGFVLPLTQNIYSLHTGDITAYSHLTSRELLVTVATAVLPPAMQESNLSPVVSEVIVWSTARAGQLQRLGGGQIPGVGVGSVDIDPTGRYILLATQEVAGSDVTSRVVVFDWTSQVVCFSAPAFSPLTLGGSVSPVVTDVVSDVAWLGDISQFVIGGVTSGLRVFSSVGCPTQSFSYEVLQPAFVGAAIDGSNTIGVLEILATGITGEAVIATTTGELLVLNGTAIVQRMKPAFGPVDDRDIDAVAGGAPLVSLSYQSAPPVPVPAVLGAKLQTDALLVASVTGELLRCHFEDRNAGGETEELTGDISPPVTRVLVPEAAFSIRHLATVKAPPSPVPSAAAGDEGEQTEGEVAPVGAKFPLSSHWVASVCLAPSRASALVTTLTNEVFEVRCVLPPPPPIDEEAEAEAEAAAAEAAAAAAEAAIEAGLEPPVYVPPEKPRGPRLGDYVPRGIRLSFPSASASGASVEGVRSVIGPVRVPGTATLLTAAADGVVRLWTRGAAASDDPASAAVLTLSAWAATDSVLLGLGCAANLAVAVSSNSLYIFNLPDLTPVAVVPWDGASEERLGAVPLSIAVAPEGNQFVVSWSDGWLEQYQPVSMSLPRTVPVVAEGEEGAPDEPEPTAEEETVIVWKRVIRFTRVGLPVPPPPVDPDAEAATAPEEEADADGEVDGSSVEGEVKAVLSAQGSVASLKPAPVPEVLPTPGFVCVSMDYSSEGTYLRAYFTHTSDSHISALALFDAGIANPLAAGVEVILTLPPKPLPPAPPTVFINEDGEEEETPQEEPEVWAGQELLDSYRALTWATSFAAIGWESVSLFSSGGIVSWQLSGTNLLVYQSLNEPGLRAVSLPFFTENAFIEWSRVSRYLPTLSEALNPSQALSNLPTNAPLSFCLLGDADGADSGSLDWLVTIGGGGMSGLITSWRVTGSTAEEGGDEATAEAEEVLNWLLEDRSAGQWVAAANVAAAEEAAENGGDDGEPVVVDLVEVDSGEEDDWLDAHELRRRYHVLPTTIPPEVQKTHSFCAQTADANIVPTTADSLPEAELSLRWIYGSTLRGTRNAVRYVAAESISGCGGAEEVVYPAGTVPVVWDKESRTQRFGPRHGGEISALDVSRDRTLVATASMNGPHGSAILVWNSKTTSLYRVLSLSAGMAGTVTAIAFSPNGQQLAAVGEDRKIQIFDISTATLIASSHPVGEPVAGKVLTLVWADLPQSATTHRLLSGGVGHFRLYSHNKSELLLRSVAGIYGPALPEAPEEEGSRPRRPHVCISAALPMRPGDEGEDASGPEFVAGLSTGSLAIIERGETRFSTVTPLFKGSVTALVVIQPMAAALGSANGLPPPPGSEPDAEYGGDPLAWRLLVGGAGGEIKLLSNDFESLWSINPFTDAFWSPAIYGLGRALGVKSLDIDRWGRKAVFGLSSGEIGEICLRTGKPILSSEAMTLSEEARNSHVQGGDSQEPDAELLVAEREANLAVQVTGHCRGDLMALAAHPLRAECLTSGADRSIRMWNLTTQRLVTRFSLPGRAIAASYSPNGQVVVVSLRPDTLAERKVTETTNLLLAAEATLAEVLARDAELAAEAAAEAVEEEEPVADGEEGGEDDSAVVKASEPTHTPEVPLSEEAIAAKAAVSEAQAALVTAQGLCRGRIVVLSYLSHRLRLVKTLADPHSAVTSLAFSPQGTALYAASSDGSLFVYDALDDFCLLQTLTDPSLPAHNEDEDWTISRRALVSVDVTGDGSMVVAQSRSGSLVAYSLGAGGKAVNPDSPIPSGELHNRLASPELKWAVRHNVVSPDARGVLESPREGLSALTASSGAAVNCIAVTGTTPAIGLNRASDVSNEVPSNGLMVAAMDDGELRLFTQPNVTIGAPYRSVTAHADTGVARVVFSADCRHLLSIGASDRLLCQWDVVQLPSEESTSENTTLVAARESNLRMKLDEFSSTSGTTLSERLVNEFDEAAYVVEAKNFRQENPRGHCDLPLLPRMIYATTAAASSSAVLASGSVLATSHPWPGAGRSLLSSPSETTIGSLIYNREAAFTSLTATAQSGSIVALSGYRLRVPYISIWHSPSATVTVSLSLPPSEDILDAHFTSLDITDDGKWLVAVFLTASGHSRAAIWQSPTGRWAGDAVFRSLSTISLTEVKQVTLFYPRLPTSSERSQSRLEAIRGGKTVGAVSAEGEDSVGIAILSVNHVVSIFDLSRFGLSKRALSTNLTNNVRSLARPLKLSDYRELLASLITEVENEHFASDYHMPADAILCTLPVVAGSSALPPGVAITPTEVIVYTSTGESATPAVIWYRQSLVRLFHVLDSFPFLHVDSFHPIAVSPDTNSAASPAVLIRFAEGLLVRFEVFSRSVTLVDIVPATTTTKIVSSLNSDNKRWMSLEKGMVKLFSADSLNVVPELRSQSSKKGNMGASLFLAVYELPGVSFTSGAFLNTSTVVVGTACGRIVSLSLGDNMSSLSLLSEGTVLDASITAMVPLQSSSSVIISSTAGKISRVDLSAEGAPPVISKEVSLLEGLVATSLDLSSDASVVRATGSVRYAGDSASDIMSFHGGVVVNQTLDGPAAVAPNSVQFASLNDWELVYPGNLDSPVWASTTSQLAPEVRGLSFGPALETLHSGISPLIPLVTTSVVASPAGGFAAAAYKSGILRVTQFPAYDKFISSPTTLAHLGEGGVPLLAISGTDTLIAVNPTHGTVVMWKF